MFTAQLVGVDKNAEARRLIDVREAEERGRASEMESALNIVEAMTKVMNERKTNMHQRMKEATKSCWRDD